MGDVNQLHSQSLHLHVGRDIICRFQELTLTYRQFISYSSIRIHTSIHGHTQIYPPHLSKTNQTVPSCPVLSCCGLFCRSEFHESFRWPEMCSVLNCSVLLFYGNGCVVLCCCMCGIGVWSDLIWSAASLHIAYCNIHMLFSVYHSSHHITSMP